MAKVSITGGRRAGKTTFLIDSIVGHITDPELKTDASLVVCAPTQHMIKLIKDAVVAKLERRKVIFSHRSGSNRNSITVDNKTIKFLPTTYSLFIGISIDYLFLDNVEQMPVEFMSFVDMIMRPSVIVIQTYDDSIDVSKYQKNVEIE